ncbi:MAG: hypothetical protein A2536_09410 [Candidatus Firestonebacteria bacterium RIFOXYD2_FULL_39_29]|nr:MAG: hypothetical protein A2536_09410 [Candidatus Firestonebacteria bacterium RIFOXYD2_FULL_39_29]
MKSYLKYIIVGILLLGGCAEKKQVIVQDDTKKVSELTAEVEDLRGLVQKTVGAMLEQAKSYVAEAKKAGAEKYAPELLSSAEDNLAKALECYESKEYDKTFSYSLRAIDDAKAAISGCIAGKSSEDKINSAKKDTKIDNKAVIPWKKPNTIEKTPMKSAPKKKTVNGKEDGSLLKMNDILVEKAFASTNSNSGKSRPKEIGRPIIIISVLVIAAIFFLLKAFKKNK